jgi:hypothetical protein
VTPRGAPIVRTPSIRRTEVALSRKGKTLPASRRRPPLIVGEIALRVPTVGSGNMEKALSPAEGAFSVHAIASHRKSGDWSLFSLLGTGTAKASCGRPPPRGRLVQPLGMNAKGAAAEREGFSRRPCPCPAAVGQRHVLCDCPYRVMHGHRSYELP